MKLTLIIGLLATVSFFSSCDKETVLDNNKVPSEIKTFVEKHFPDHQILQVTKDVDGTTRTYDVILSNSVTLEFNRKKEIIEIESDSKLPDSVIPQTIREYVTTNYPDNFIRAWELDDNKKQNIKLDNDMELEFDKDGKFLRIDS